MKTLLVLLGPTGVGKTDLSIEIARYFDTSVISCDSRQIYKEMRIGTAVPSAEQLAAVQHFLYRLYLYRIITIPGNSRWRLCPESENCLKPVMLC